MTETTFETIVCHKRKHATAVMSQEVWLKWPLRGGASGQANMFIVYATNYLTPNDHITNCNACTSDITK